MKQTNLLFGHFDLKFSFRVFLSFCLSFCQLEPGVVAYESVAYKKSMYPTNFYLFRVNNRNARKRCEIYSKLKYVERLRTLTLNIFHTFF